MATEHERQQALESIFNLIDVNQNGFLEHHELTAVMETFGRTGAEEDVRDLLNQLDKDQSGKLSLSEFLVLSNQITHSDKNSCLAVIQQLYLNEDFASRVFRMRGKKAFIFDMDGVIYRGGRLIEGVTAVVSWLRETNKVFRFLTNNSRDTPSYLKEKLTKLGVSDVDETMFWTAALSTAAMPLSMLLSRQPPSWRIAKSPARS